MTMTLDEVRKTRFHMSRRNGYEVTDVDIFVDKVEATLMTITEQNDHLRRQLEAAQTGGNNPELQAEVDRLRAEVQRLRGSADEAASLQVEKERMQAELDQARAGAGDSGLVEENQRLRQLAENHQREAADTENLATENEHLKGQIAELNSRPVATGEGPALSTSSSRRAPKPARRSSSSCSSRPSRRRRWWRTHSPTPSVAVPRLKSTRARWSRRPMHSRRR